MGLAVPKRLILKKSPSLPLSVLFFSFNIALADLEAARRSDLTIFSSVKKYTEAQPRDFLTMADFAPAAAGSNL